MFWFIRQDLSIKTPFDNGTPVIVYTALVSQAAIDKMISWEGLPADWVDEDFGHYGLGLEYNKTPYGNSVGHTVGIDGFLSIAQYFPEQEATFILLVNSGSYENKQRLTIYRQSLAEIFK